MGLIQKIKIEHFRSINEISIIDLSHINVFSGLNDVGKSNVIKALNLFFNNQVDWRSELDFYRDINVWHSHRAVHEHNKRDISVRIEFKRPKGRYESLPDRFWVKREWDKDNQLQPLRESWGENWKSNTEQKWKRGLTWFLKQCKFHYVPAVRDRGYLLHLLAEFSKSITEAPDKELQAASEQLSKLIAVRSQDLHDKVKQVADIGISLELPKTMLAMLEASRLSTDGDIPLQLRGDGIQSLTVAGILADLSGKSNSHFHFWGFEEPENSLEYAKAGNLADEMLHNYAKIVQVFVTTHSPAFVALQEDGTSIYRLASEEKEYRTNSKRLKCENSPYTSIVTQCIPAFGVGMFNEVRELAHELGHLKIMRRIDREYREFENLKQEHKELQRKLENNVRPLLVVEGPHDCKTLRHAWSRIFRIEMPFDILDAGGTTKITKLICNSRTGERKIFALYNHEQSGIAEINKLSNFGFEQIKGDGYFRYIFNDRIVAQTLPAPPGRQCNADNHNLSLEHYFSDETLLKVDDSSSNPLLSRNNYVRDRQTYHVDDEMMKREIEEGRITLCHRSFDNSKGKKQSGKSILTQSLNCFPNEEFESFDSLLTTIVQYLAPHMQLIRIGDTS